MNTPSTPAHASTSLPPPIGQAGSTSGAGVNSRTAFLLCRPVMDYEESIDPRLIFSTRAKALKAKKVICEAVEKLIASFPPWPEECDSFEARFDSPLYEIRTKMVHTFKAPFGWRLGYRDLDWNSDSFNRECVEIMELTLDAKP